MALVNVQVDISPIKNEVTQIHTELYATYNMTDTQRRDTVNRLVERVRHLKTLLESNDLSATLK